MTRGRNTGIVTTKVDFGARTSNRNSNAIVPTITVGLSNELNGDGSDIHERTDQWRRRDFKGSGTTPTSYPSRTVLTAELSGLASEKESVDCSSVGGSANEQMNNSNSMAATDCPNESAASSNLETDNDISKVIASAGINLLELTDVFLKVFTVLKNRE